jgi:hypothetical protein
MARERDGDSIDASAVLYSKDIDSMVGCIEFIDDTVIPNP